MPFSHRIATLARAGVVASWLVMVGAGLGLLSAYAATPGRPAHPPERWPSASTIARRPDLPTILVFAHPGCPCTRATLGEIDWLLARIVGQADVHVLLLESAGGDGAVPDTSLERMATAIPTVQVQRDSDGDEASRFGVATSGQVLLYDTGGRLRFAGGITGARGHAGDNAGRDELLMQLTAADAESAGSPVFGCGLWSPPAT